MSCYIASNDNRVYAALETSYGAVGLVNAEVRIPAVQLAIRQAVEQPERRDKTGGRTFPGLPGGFRRRTTFDLTAYMAGWDVAEPEPCYGPLFQASLGGQALAFTGRTITVVLDPLQFQTSTPHGLAVGQAVRFGGELRFTSAIVNPTTFVINAPFGATPQPGAALGKTVTYLPATTLASVSLFDYWSPQAALQRILAGAAVNQFRARVNGDFHQFSFSGPAATLIDSATFASGLGGLTNFPAEPAAPLVNFSLVPGNLGQAWFGAQPEQFHTVVSAEIELDNNVDIRAREFGRATPQCIAAGRRAVSVDFLLVSNTDAETTQLYQAAVQRSPIGVMFQLGQTEAHLCGIYMSALIPEVPEFDDDETRLHWRFRNCRAQGTANDEMIVAFG